MNRIALVSASLLFLWLVLWAASAQSVPLNGLMRIDPKVVDPSDGSYVSGSYFSMGAGDPEIGVSLIPGPAGGILLGTYQPFILNPNTPHPEGHPNAPYGGGSGYAKAPTSESDLLLDFPFFGHQTYIGTNPVSYQSGRSHPVPSADVDALGNLTVELSAWEVMWNGSAFEQGPRPMNTGPFVPAAGTYDKTTGFYSLDWSSQIKNGPFHLIPGYWHLEGTVVPEPASLLLLGSGLIGLFGIRRRR